MWMLGAAPKAINGIPVNLVAVPVERSHHQPDVAFDWPI